MRPCLAPPALSIENGAKVVIGGSVTDARCPPQHLLGFGEPSQVGEVRNLSPYALSPLLWLALVVVGVGVALRLAPTRFGWAAAVTLSVLATPRLLAYQLSTLLAGLRVPDPEPGPSSPPAERPA